MWELFSRKSKFTAISIFTVIFIILYLFAGLSFPGVPRDIGAVLVYSKFVSYLATYWAGIFLFLKFFGMYIWMIPGVGYLLNEYVGPDLRGRWRSSISYTDEGGKVCSKELKFVIKMSLFDFSMVMVSEGGYSFSHVVLSRLLKDELLGGFVLYYVFESEVVNPASTDVGVFQGSAKLRVNASGPLQGVYWTNRNWNNRMQTAGFIELCRE